MVKAERYRAIARDYLRRAERATDAARRRLLLDMAQRWLDDARLLEKHLNLVDAFEDTFREAQAQLGEAGRFAPARRSAA
jgi:hypothetical protein